MLVAKRMSSPVITLPPDMPINEAHDLMRKENIRRAPVVAKGKMLGIVTDRDLQEASPSKATSLSIWEIHYLLSRITVREVMTEKVLTIREDTPIEEAAHIMADNDIGGLPVMHGKKIVGMITETDLFKAFLDLFGARQKGVRISLLAKNQPGDLARLSQAVYEAGGNIISLGAFAGSSPSEYNITMKVDGIEQAKLKTIIEPLVVQVLDIRSV
jgi:acetoin utilization protein AcuB